MYNNLGAAGDTLVYVHMRQVGPTFLPDHGLPCVHGLPGLAGCEILSEFCQGPPLPPALHTLASSLGAFLLRIHTSVMYHSGSTLTPFMQACMLSASAEKPAVAPATTTVSITKVRLLNRIYFASEHRLCLGWTHL